MRQGVLYALFFLSGCSALIYELVWQRTLNLVFGVSTLSVSAVLAAFMGGLALGGLVFGRMVDRTRRPLRLYALLEAGIGAGAILLPMVFSVLPGIYVWLHAHLHPAPWGGAVLKFALAFPVLLGLASLIGGTVPVMARLVMDRRDALSRKFSLLYAINTVGAVLGTGLTGFMLLRHFGMQQTVWLAASLNSFIALTAWLVGLKSTGPKNLTSDTDGERNNSSSLVATSGQRNSPSSKLIFICAGLTGMASMGLEVGWARILGILTSNSAFGFALLLILLLGGFGVGSLVHALWARFPGDSWRRLAFIQWALAAVVMGGLPFLHTSPRWLDRCCDGSSVTAVFLGEFGLTALAVFVPGILMGMSLPLLVAAGAGKRITVGRWLGRIYAINTLGCVIGAFATGFLLIPWLGIQSSVGLLLGVYLVVGMAAWYKVSQLSRPWRWGGIVLALGIYVGGWQILPAEGYFKSRIEEPRQLIYYQEGNNATVTVVEEFDGVRSIMVDGQPVAGTVGTSLIDQKMLAHLPLLLHPAPHRALTVGFGSGGTSWSMLLHNIDVDCVEIEQAVPGAADHFLSENHGVLSHSRFRLIVDDARSWLRVALRCDRDRLHEHPVSKQWRLVHRRLLSSHERAPGTGGTCRGLGAGQRHPGGRFEGTLTILSRGLSPYQHLVHEYPAHGFSHRGGQPRPSGN
jgi:spermidine synthase